MEEGEFLERVVKERMESKDMREKLLSEFRGQLKFNMYEVAVKKHATL